MDIFRDELVSTLLFAPDYLPDVLQWLKRQPAEDGRISRVSAEKILAVLGYPCWQKFFHAYTRPCELSDEDLLAAEYKLLTETGLARIESVRILGEAGKRYNLYMTETARQMFSEYDPFQMVQEKRRRSLIHLFAAAAVNVYGVIEKDVFINLFNQYSESTAKIGYSGELTSFEPLSLDELESALTPYTELHVDVLLEGDYLMNRLVGGPDDLPPFLAGVSSNEYCPVDMDAFLKYADSEYFEVTPEIASFIKKLKEKLPDISEGEVKLIKLLFSPSYLSEWSQMIEVALCPMLKSLPGEEQREMAELFVRAIRSARSWRFRGFSEETALKGEGLEEEVREFMRALEEC